MHNKRSLRHPLIKNSQFNNVHMIINFIVNEDERGDGEVFKSDIPRPPPKGCMYVHS